MSLLFCLGLEVYSNSDVPSNGIEISAERSCEDNNILSEGDSFDDDHINKVAEPYLVPESLKWIPVSYSHFLLIQFSYSNWQPPKHS